MAISSNKQIAKNTIYLYIRMLIVMAVTIYTARVVLEVLGITDYGIYNLVGGVVVLFNFLNSSMTGCTQRYLCVAIGQENMEYIQEVFSTSIKAHLLISILFLILAETVGLWFVSTVLNIPAQSKISAIIVYEIAIFTAISGIMRVPYNGAIIAYEKMSFYAISSIIETALKLIILLPLVYLALNKLILYSVLVGIVNLVILIWYYLYVTKKFINCRLNFSKTPRELLKEMMKFTGWSNFSSLSNLTAKQGMGFLLNNFLGVTINAAIGIMNQVTNAIYGFINNFMTAVNPPLIKQFVNKDWNNLSILFVRSSKFSFYLMLILSIPVVLNINTILSIWLINIPQYTNYFCALSLISLLPNVFGGPIWTLIQASGEIKSYQITIGILIVLNLPIDYLLLYFKQPPYSLLYVTALINFGVVLCGIHKLNKITNINWKLVTAKIFLPCAVVLVISLIVCYLSKFYIHSTSIIIQLVANVVFEVLIVCALSFMVGLNRNERNSIINLIVKKL